MFFQLTICVIIRLFYQIRRYKSITNKYRKVSPEFSPRETFLLFRFTRSAGPEKSVQPSISSKTTDTV